MDSDIVRLGDRLDTLQFGQYQCVELLGRGGMAVVYKALQPGLKRYVALKALLLDTGHQDGWRDRFHREAEIVARLEHPNILPTYDYGEADGLPYMVMQLVTGGTMREWLGKNPPLERKVTVFRQVLGALAHAHGQQPAIIHRDVKPTNVLMTETGWPLLADFGIAKIMEPTGPGTDSGTRCGTPQYMSPEQSQGRAVDQRTDLYAMGIMLYKLLTGRVPFVGKNPIAILHQQVQREVPPPSGVNTTLAPVWDALIQRALAKQPADRYSDAHALDAAVAAAWDEQQHLGAEETTVWVPNPDELYACAVRALVEGNWPRVISLCGEILEADEAHAEASHLLGEASKALHYRGTAWPGLLPPGSREPRPPLAILILRHGTQAGPAYVLDAQGATLGRGHDADVVLSDNTVSRRHCRIAWAGGAYHLADLNSSNGTYLNGAEVCRAPLRPGDLIQVGEQALEFVHAGGEASSPAGLERAAAFAAESPVLTNR